MNDFNKLLILLEPNAIDKVRNSLAECQYYSDTITQGVLKKSGIDKGSLSLTDVIALLSERKDKKITFFFLKSKDLTYIYSNFFNFNDYLNAVLSSFSNLKSPVFLCEIEKEKLLFSVIVNGRIKKSHTIEIDCDLNITSNIYSEKDTVTQEIISFVTSNYKLSNSKMNKYLISHCLFKDEYII